MSEKSYLAHSSLFEKHFLPGCFGLGLNLANQEFQCNYEFPEWKVKWFSITLMLLSWNISIRYPYKIYESPPNETGE